MNFSHMFDENEKPLDSFPADGGFVGIFRTIACIGDSLSSGEFEGTGAEGQRTYHDMFDFSWGQYLARMAGTTVYNFSRGGMTAEEYMKTFAKEKGFFDPSLAASAYIVALGVNDMSRVIDGRTTFGDLSDIDFSDGTKNKPTFAGYYAAVLQAYRAIRPDAFFFLMTMPSTAFVKDTGRDVLFDRHRDFLYALAKRLPRTYVLDFRTYAPPYAGDFERHFYLGGHMNPMGYMLTARMTVSYIDYIIRHNTDDFAQVGFIGTPYRNTEGSGCFRPEEPGENK